MCENPIPPAERLQVSPTEAAHLLSISLRTLQRKVKAGEIPAIGAGRLLRFAVDDLRAWQERNRVTAQE